MIEKVTIVTGGTKGIGEGCARVFCEAGARVVICARGREAGEVLAAELTAKGPGECRFQPCDVSKPEEIQRVINHTVEIHGRLDCLINNAGWHPPLHTIDDFSVDDFIDLLHLNLVSYFAGCKFALPHLRKTQGSIVNVGSIAGKNGDLNSVTYCASKGGISALTKALAIDEARHGVRVNAVIPGNIVTALRREAEARAEDPQALNDFLESQQWAGRSGTIEEVGHACLFLASDASSFITGVDLIVSGGLELGPGRKASRKLT